MSFQNMSWGELVKWQNQFRDLAEKFNLLDEFTENGIIYFYD